MNLLQLEWIKKELNS
jgi:hypothetical protein